MLNSAGEAGDLRVRVRIRVSPSPASPAEFSTARRRFRSVDPLKSRETGLSPDFAPLVLLHSPFSPFSALRSMSPRIQLGVWGSAVSFPSGFWGGAPAEIELYCFCIYICISTV